MHHSFDIHLAKKYGVNAAIIIHHFQHWIAYNKRTNRNLIDGKTWSYQTLDDITAHFPYFSKSEVFEILERLCTGKGRRSKKPELDFEPVLIKGNFNKTEFDRTTWYAFRDEEKFIVKENSTVLAQAKIEVGSSPNGDWLEPTPIPDTKQDPKQDSKQEEKKKLKKEKKPVREWVELSQEESDKFFHEYEKPLADTMLDILDAYNTSRQDHYKSDYGALKKSGWVHKEALRRLQPKTPYNTAKIDRRTLNIDGTPTSSIHDGRF